MIFPSSAAHLAFSLLKNHQILQKVWRRWRKLFQLFYYLNCHFWNQKCSQCALRTYIYIIPYQCLQLTPLEFLYNKHAWYLDKVLPKPQPLVCTMKANWKSNWLDFLSSIRNGRSYFSTILYNESNSIDQIDRLGEQISIPMGERLSWKFNIVKCFSWSNNLLKTL